MTLAQAAVFSSGLRKNYFSEAQSQNNGQAPARLKHTGCSKRPRFSPARPERARTRISPNKAAANETKQDQVKVTAEESFSSLNLRLNLNLQKPADCFSILLTSDCLEHVFRWNEDGQCDDGRPLPLLSDGGLGDVQGLHDFPTHLEDLLAFLPRDVRIELDT